MMVDFSLKSSYGDSCQWYEDNANGCATFGNDVGSFGMTPIEACEYCIIRDECYQFSKILNIHLVFLETGCVCAGTTAEPPSGGSGGECTDYPGWTDS